MPLQNLFNPLPLAVVVICLVGFYLSLVSEPFSPVLTAQGVSKPTVKPSYTTSTPLPLPTVYSSVASSPTPILISSSPITTPSSVSNPTSSPLNTTPKAENLKNSSTAVIVPKQIPPTTPTLLLFTQPSIQQPTTLTTQSYKDDWNRLSAIPQVVWLGGWISNIREYVSTYTSAATKAKAVPTLVLYNIPFRDCGNYSAGGTNDSASYKLWVQAIVAGGRNSGAKVIVEPDALALTNCLSEKDLSERYELLRYTVQELSAAGMQPYLDAGHSGWVTVEQMASKLQKAGIAQATGFSLNVSNFQRTTDEIKYGTALSAATNGKHFIIDTSRNGNGPPSDFSWCNPAGRKIGEKPTLQTNTPLVDAFLWVKHPGESDGECNGGPRAGEWWPEYAHSLLY